MKSDLIHIVDDDTAVRRSLRMVLRPYGYRVSAWPDAAAFLAGAPLHEPACVLIDCKMPGISGIELQAELSARGVPLAAIMLSGQADVSTAVATLRMGAVTLIEKPLDLKLLIAAVDDAFEALRNRTVGEIIRSDAAEQLNRLSPRELQVLRAITDGQQNKMIALQLGISPRTVEVYRANIMDKLDCENLASLLKIVFRAGLFDSPHDGFRRPAMPAERLPASG
ncbi:response regulator [Sphingopyxis panaciterrulae]|uniref:Two-component system response regulator FixJ n=1 Tax=Sphingopyxis panaciterrulae TaxID=462372 RepID=A0A7W9ENR7_9SPHN|nr:two-component system response regulator FixJ [Sphingopyxis panaciterrulae]